MQSDINLELVKAISEHNAANVQRCLHEGADPNYTWTHDAESGLDSSFLQPTTPLSLLVFLISDSLLSEEDLSEFYEIADKVEIPQETVDQYNRFIIEYNAFVHNFRASISELKKYTRTEIEPPSVKLANELSQIRPPQVTLEEEVKPSQTKEHKGYIL